MKQLIVLLALATFASGALAAEYDRGAQKAKQACAACHGADGNAPLRPDYPRIAGQHEDYLYKALREYRSGARKNAIMAGQAANLSRQDMQDLAVFFSSQKGSLGVIR